MATPTLNKTNFLYVLCNRRTKCLVVLQWKVRLPLLQICVMLTTTIEEFTIIKQKTWGPVARLSFRITVWPDKFERLALRKSSVIPAFFIQDANSPTILGKQSRKHRERAT
ncbi:hypothetical protein CDAR_268571 [Caerostris darwini]|uniref:Uncharacterized protein n=1 Tax=Caerostris darwini TaxID=1538125 RepID=A0AAV4X5I6_9ARAC|nr:hypothetical protein CDAR_268571 [Caerostris darwini]